MINNIGNINQENITDLNSVKTSQVANAEGLKKNPYATFNKDYLIDESQISKDAIKLYEREKDITKFTQLALNGIEEDNTTEFLMQTLFAEGVADIDNDDIWEKISKNNKLIEDIMG